MIEEVYAALEITKKEIRFIVGKYRDSRELKVIFKDKVKGNWLNDRDEVVDINAVYHRVNRAINRYEITFKEKLESIAVVYPTKTLNIKQASPVVFLEKHPKIFGEKEIEELHSLAKKVNFDEKNIVFNIRPYSFTINNTISKSEPPIGVMANSVTMKAKVYTIAKEVYESHNKIIEKCNKTILNKNNRLYALALQCAQNENFRENFVLVNWDINQIDLGFFGKETLVKVITINSGVNSIVESLANKMYSKYDVAEKYLFKLTDFATQNQKSVPIYRKYLNDKKITHELTSSEIKDMLMYDFKGIIKIIDKQIEKEFENIPPNFKIYHTGKITEVSGFEKILLESKYKTKSLIYFSVVTGASEIWATALCGAILYNHIKNKHKTVFKTSTNTIERPINYPMGQPPFGFNQHIIGPQVNIPPNEGFEYQQFPHGINNWNSQIYYPNQIPNQVYNNQNNNPQSLRNDSNIGPQNGIINTQRDR